MNRFESVTKPLRWFMALLLVVLVAGCGRGPILGGADLVSVVSITVTPPSATIPRTGNQRFTATASFSDGTSRDVTESTTWTKVDTPFVAGTTVSNLSVNCLGAIGCTGSGIATGVNRGTSTITAKYQVGTNIQTKTVILTVNDAISMSFKVKPAAATIPRTGNQHFTAIETFSDGSTYDRTDDAAWTKSDAPFVSGDIVSNLSVNCLGAIGCTGSGIATGVNKGISTITASYGTYTGIVGLADRTATLTVNNATVMSIQVTPALASVAKGSNQNYLATAILSDGTTNDVTANPLTTWTATDVPTPPGATPVASVGLTGVAAGLNLGQSDIRAAFGGQTSPAGGAILTVIAGPFSGPAGAVDLKSLITYGLISHDAMTISDIPTTHIYGDVALTAADSLVGFGTGSTANPPTSPHVTGVINTQARGDTAAAALAQGELVTTYADLSGRSPTVTYPAGDKPLSGLVLTPGIYRVGAAAAGDTFSLANTSGPLVLDAQGNPDAVFIFQASDITTTTGSVLLQGGAQPKNVFWVMTATATIGNGSGTVFQGTIVAGTSITVNGANVEGRMLAGASGAGAIGGVNSVITVP